MLEIEEIGLKIYDIIGGQNGDKFETYFALYEQYLPQYLHYGPLMRHRAFCPVDPESPFQWHQWLVCQYDQPIGMETFLYNRRRNLGLSLDLVVLPEARAVQYKKHTRMAGLILSLVREQVVRDAHALGKPTPVCLVGEVEHLPLVERYDEYGFIPLPIEYYEPPFTPDLAALADAAEIESKIGYRRLYVGVFTISGMDFNPNDPQIIREILYTLLVDHYNLPEDHWIMRTALQSIPS